VRLSHLNFAPALALGISFPARVISMLADCRKLQKDEEIKRIGSRLGTAKFDRSEAASARFAGGGDGPHFPL
jgi:hypothetical protein